MALTAKQRNALPASAFVYPSRRAYPVPTKAQAAKAGISERQRLGLHRNALSRAAQSGTTGSYATVGSKVRARAGGKVASVKAGAKGGKSRSAAQVKARRR
jgi:protoporphyrinogen oxidase